MGSATEIQGYLDQAAAEGYLDAINGTTPESLIDAEKKVERFVDMVAASGLDLPILSIGVGQGEELHAIKNLEPSLAVAGFDLSRSALARTMQRSSLYGLDLLLSCGDACKLPLQSQSVGGVIMSAVLHEVYSYRQSNGYEGLNLAIGEAARIIAPGGTLYIREFAAPDPIEPVELVPISPEAQEFYAWFVTEFTSGIDECGGGVRVAVDENGRLTSTGDLTQVLMHFKNFWHDLTRGSTSAGDASWKELRESYLVKKDGEEQYATPEKLCELITEASAAADAGVQLEALSLLERKKTNIFLRNHFRIVNATGLDISDMMIPKSTAKMEALFRRIK